MELEKALGQIEQLTKSQQCLKFDECMKQVLSESDELQKRLKGANKEIESLKLWIQNEEGSKKRNNEIVSDRKHQIDQLQIDIESVRDDIRRNDEQIQLHVQRKLKASANFSKADIATIEKAVNTFRSHCLLTGVRWDISDRLASSGCVVNPATNKVKLFHIGDDAKNNDTEILWEVIEKTTVQNKD